MQGHISSFEDQLKSGPVEELAEETLDDLPKIDGTLEQIMISSNTREEMVYNLKEFIDTCLKKLEGKKHVALRELFVKAKDHLEARDIRETITLIRQAATIVVEGEL